MIPLRLMVSASSWPKLKTEIVFRRYNLASVLIWLNYKGNISQTVPCFNTLNQLTCHWIWSNFYLPGTSAVQSLSGIVRHDSCPVSCSYKLSEMIVIVCDKVTTAFSCQTLQQTVIEELDKCEITRKYCISSVTLPTLPKDNQEGHCFRCILMKG